MPEWKDDESAKAWVDAQLATIVGLLMLAARAATLRESIPTIQEAITQVTELEDFLEL